MTDAALAAAWLESLRHQRRLSPATLRNYEHALGLLFAQLEGTPLAKVEPQQVRRMVARLHAGGLSGKTLALTLSAWRGLYHWLVRHQGYAANPARGVRAPKSPKTLPKVLSVEQMQRLLDAPQAEGARGPQAARDHAMFELLYSSGLRLAELVALDVGEGRDSGRLDLRQAEVTVTGKGSKTRTVPVGARAREALHEWLRQRAQLVAPLERALFVGARGKRISPGMVQVRLRAWARARGLDAPVHPHLLRHSFATHVLQSSQDLRAVQEMLGHASTATTQVYTHLDFQALAKVYDAAHPRARKK